MLFPKLALQHTLSRPRSSRLARRRANENPGVVMRLIKPYSDVQAGHGAEGRQTSDKLPGSSDSGYGGDDKHQVQSQLGALDTVLNLPPPDSPKRSVKPPHLNMPRYVHHFDTYSMVRNLQTGGFSKEQAIITMKAMRLILTNNMDIAKKGLVDKGSVENETYLFRAACSELRTEVQNNRKVAANSMRTGRNQLANESDMLKQKLVQDSISLKDDLKGMFDDRKMTVRIEQKAVESKIQELNYRITINLASDARSAVESLRWMLVRRAAITIALSALMILATLQYSTYLSRLDAVEYSATKGNSVNEREKSSASSNTSDRVSEKLGDDQSASTADSISTATEEGSPSVAVKSGYVSLG